jgi:hypothetical protein
MAADDELNRRGLLLALAAAIAGGCNDRGCSKQPDGAESIDRSLVDISEVEFGPAEGGPQKAIVLKPRWGAAQARYPLLIALHGRGESNRGLDVGARGWTRDYYLDRAFARLRRPPLTRDDIFQIGTQDYVRQLNERVTAHPFRGLVVACPYTPDILGTKDLGAAEPFAAFLVEHLIPKLRSSYPVDPSPSATGIDGVSLGGRVALLAGLSRIDSFGAIGTLQAAVRAPEVAPIAEIATRAMRGRAKPIPLRLLTSDDDPFRPALQALSQTLNGQGVKTEFVQVAGPHDYIFNQGPGSYEMLMWHDRALRGELG